MVPFFLLPVSRSKNVVFPQPAMKMNDLGDKHVIYRDSQAPRLSQVVMVFSTTVVSAGYRLRANYPRDSKILTLKVS